MKNFFHIQWFRNISIAKKLYFVVSIMAVLIVLELGTLFFAIHTLSSVRALVGGEGLWSKSQKDAIYNLRKYYRTHNEDDEKEFYNFMKVPLGDHKALVELLKENPDLKVARQGFIEGQNHPDDVDGMIKLFRRFHNNYYIHKAINIWAEADSNTFTLVAIAEELHLEINSSSPSQEKLDHSINEVYRINQKLRVLGDEFSSTLGEGSRWLENLILKLLFLVVLMAACFGLTLTFTVIRGIRKGLNEVNRVAEKITKGNFHERITVLSKDEIGTVATSINQMTEQLAEHINKLQKSGSELKESEGRLKETNHQLQSFFDNALDLIQSVNTEAKYLYVNKAWKETLEYTDEEVAGLTIQSIIHPDSMEHCTGLFAQIIQGIDCKALEMSFISKSGKKIDVMGSITVHSENGLPVTMGIFKNITERKKAELALDQKNQELEREQEKFKNAQTIAHIGSWDWDIVKNTVAFSDELCRIYGLNCGEFAADFNGFINLIHPEDKEFAKKMITEAADKSLPLNFHHRIVRPNKSVGVLHTIGQIIQNKDGKPIRMEGTEQDVTEQFHKEELEKLVLAATQSYNSVIIFDTNEKTEWVNEGFTRLTGYTLDDMKDKSIELLRKGNDAGISQQRTMMDFVLKEKKPLTYENINYTKEGKEYWVITTATPILGKHGEVERIIAIDTDITLRKKMEEQLLQANKIADHSLDKGIKAIDELMKAKKEIEESMKVKEQFVANMSHEIRTPMNAIVGFTDLLLKTELNPDQQQYTEAVKTSGKTLLVIVNDLLDFSKNQSGKLIFEQIDFSTSLVVSTVTELMLPKSMEKNIRLSAVIDPAIHDHLIGDPTRLNQILVNLVGNGIKFTEKGEVKITVDLVSEVDNVMELKFSVSDTGIGIPENKLCSIFEVFAQASSETTRKYGGSGLGLTIAKQLIGLQGGTIAVKSEVDKGSVFSFNLKFKKNLKPEAEKNNVLEHHEIQALEGLTVLLAEDNLLNQILAKKLMADWKCKVDVANNGLIAIDKLNKNNYDLILMDIQMPEMDGYEATRIIRNTFAPPKRDIPIIAVTAHALTGEVEKCLNAGMNDYISKPYDANVLYSKIKSVLKGNDFS